MAQTFTVMVDENGHYRDEGERYEHGTFGCYDEVLAACRRIVDEFLMLQHRPGMAAAELYSLFTTFGEDPFIVPERPEGQFSAWAYARLRCDQLCSG